MHKIRSWLYIGNYQEAQDEALLKENGINGVVQLFRPVDYNDPTLEALYLPVEEGYPLLKATIQQGIAFITERQSRGQTLLMSCGAGVSRSVTFGIIALVETEGLTLPQAFAEIRAHHPKAMPDEILWDSLCKYYNQPIDYWEMWSNLELK